MLKAESKENKVLIVSHNHSAGAGRAAYRLHKALREHDVDSKMLVSRKEVSDDSVQGFGKLYYVHELLRRFGSSKVGKILNLNTRGPFSLNLFPSWTLRAIRGYPDHVVNLHWIHSEFLSLKQASRIQQPVVWTLHDMWAITGVNHYEDDSNNAGWRVGYSKSNTRRFINVDRAFWLRKKRLYNQNWRIVSPSSWLGGLCDDSPLFYGKSTKVIPNPIDLDFFRPFNQKISRDIFSIPENSRVILFGAYSLGANNRKGADLLFEAISKIDSLLSNVIGIVFGASLPKVYSIGNVEIRWVGKISDDRLLPLLYSSADVTAVPSRQDNLPQVATESISCGCPVVAYDVGGLRDIVEHKGTGYIAAPFSCEDFANGLAWALKCKIRGAELKENCRISALEKWGSEKTVGKYISLFEEVRIG